MDLYTFKVERFWVNATRSPSDDTLQLAYAALVDGNMVANKVLDLSFEHGDFGKDPGVYDPDDYVSDNGLTNVVINDPMAKVAFSFQLVNANNVPAGALTGRVSSTADQMAGIGAGLAAAGQGSIKDVLEGTAKSFAAAGLFWVSIALEVFANIYALINVDCDGPVAVDQIGGPRYAIDAWTDNDSRTIRADRKSYPGTGSPTGCGAGTSDYEASWWLRHSRAWVPVTDDGAQPLVAEHSVGAAAHNGAVHAFGIDGSQTLLAATSLTGASWSVKPIASNSSTSGLLPDLPVNPRLPVSAVSFNDRLSLLGIQPDGSITSPVYTSDGGSWALAGSVPQGLRTEMGIATTVFRHRLYVIAKDSSTNDLRVTSTDDLITWDPWTGIPEPQLDPASALPAGWTASSVAAAALADSLHVFAVYSAPQPGDPRARLQRARAPSQKVLLHNSTPQGRTWTGWQRVERGTPLAGAGMPLDVAAAAYQGRIYIASRWDTVRVLVGDEEIVVNDVIAVNFSEDGDNWSGWRIPRADQPAVIAGRAASTTVALAGLGDHLYIFAPEPGASYYGGHVVWVY